MKAACTTCGHIGKFGDSVRKHRNKLLCWPCIKKVEKNKDSYLGELLRAK